MYKSMKAHILTVSAVSTLSLSACVAQQGMPNFYNAPKKAVAQDGLDALHELDAFQKKPNCNSPHLKSALAMADAAGAEVASVQRDYLEALKMGPISGSDSPYQRHQLDDIVPAHTMVLFSIGDTAEANGCNGTAEAAYKRVLDMYVGSAYSGYRDRGHDESE